MITLFDRVSFREFATNVQRTQKCFSWCKSHLRSGLIKTFFRLKISRNGRAFDVPRNGTGANKAFLQQREREKELSWPFPSVLEAWNGWKNGGRDRALPLLGG